MLVGVPVEYEATKPTTHDGSHLPPRSHSFNKLSNERSSQMHAFRAAVESGDHQAVIALLAEDVVFRSPVVFQPYHGRDTLAAILLAVSRVFEDFRYEGEIGSADSRDHALVFNARIGNREVHGCDFLHIDENGLIDDFSVMVRPLSAALALAEAMKVELEAAQRELGVEVRL